MIQGEPAGMYLERHRMDMDDIYRRSELWIGSVRRVFPGLGEELSKARNNRRWFEIDVAFTEIRDEETGLPIQGQTSGARNTGRWILLNSNNFRKMRNDAQRDWQVRHEIVLSLFQDKKGRDNLKPGESLDLEMLLMGTPMPTKEVIERELLKKGIIIQENGFQTIDCDLSVEKMFSEIHKGYESVVPITGDLGSAYFLSTSGYSAASRGECPDLENVLPMNDSVKRNLDQAKAKAAKSALDKCNASNEKCSADPVFEFNWNSEAFADGTFRNRCLITAIVQIETAAQR